MQQGRPSRTADILVDVKAGAGQGNEDAGILQKPVGLVDGRHAAAGDSAHLPYGGRLCAGRQRAVVDPLANEINDPLGSLHAILPRLAALLGAPRFLRAPTFGFGVSPKASWKNYSLRCAARQRERKALGRLAGLGAEALRSAKTPRNCAD